MPERATVTVSQAMPGCYGVVRTGGLMGALIRLTTRSQVNHAFVVLDDASIVEARMLGAKRMALHEYDRHLVIYNDTEPLSSSDREGIIAAARMMVGARYNFLDLAVLALASLGVRWKWAARRVESRHGMICSQLVDRAYLIAGVHLYDDGRLTGAVTPGDLLLRLAQHPWVTR